MTVFVFVKMVVCCLRSSASDGAVLASLFHLPCLLCLAPRLLPELLGAYVYWLCR